MKSKRLLSLLLSLLMIVGMIPMSVFADETAAPAVEEEEIISEEETTEEIEETVTEEAPVLAATDELGHELLTVTVDPSLYPACEHSNRTTGYTDYEFSYPNAVSLTVTFAAESEFGFDENVSVNDGEGNYVVFLDRWSVSGASFTVSGDSFSMSMYSYRGDNSYGFEIESIVATVTEHTGSTAGTSLAPTCTEDGYEAGFICDICGEDIHGEIIPATGHNFVETVIDPTEDEFGYSVFECSGCEESYIGKYRGYGPHYQDDITDTISWIMEDGVLYILGTGKMPDEWINYKNWLGQENITSVIISEGITHISTGAFQYEDTIANITIPSTVKTIGELAFYYAPALKNITLPSGLESIGNSAFSGSGITSITIPDSVTYIGGYAFQDCRDLAEVNFGSGLETIELMAFQNCVSLTSVSFPSNICRIMQSAFRYCSNLQEITFDEPVARGGYSEGLYLGIDAFAFCDLREVDLPSNTESIDGSTFTGNTQLTAVNVSTTQTLNSIEGPCYLTDDRGCVYEWDLDYSTNEYYKQNLVVVPGAISGSYTVPDSVTTIEAEIRDMPNLTSFTFGAGYGGILYAYAYLSCPNLASVTAGGSESDGSKWYNDESGALLYKREGSDYAQLYYVPIAATEYTIPADVNDIASLGAFSNCKKLTNVYVEDGSNHFKSIDGVLYNADGNYLELYPAGKTDTSFRIIADVEGVSDTAFAGVTYLEELYFEGDFIWVEFKNIADDGLTVWYPADNDTWDEDMLEALAQEYKIAYGFELIFKPYGGEEPTEIAAPENVKGSNISSSGKNKISWDEVENAEEYKVYRATSKTGEYTLLDTVTGTSLTDSSAEASTTYYYYVIAVAADGTASEKSEIVTRTCDCAKPVIKASNVASSGKIKITWDAVEGAEEYKVYRATSKTGKYYLMKTTEGTSYTNTGAVANKTYYYKVKAYGSKSAAASAYSSVVSRTCDCARPAVTATNVASSGKIKLTWKEVDGAVEYKVYRATSKTGKYYLKETTESLSWTDTGATAGKLYYYKVKAIGTKSAATSAYSLVDSRRCDLKRPVVKITTSSGKPKVSWSEVDGAKEYKIYRATSKSGTYKLVMTTENEYWKDTTAVKGKTYYYKVKAIHSNSAANSAYSLIKYIKCTK